MAGTREGGIKAAATTQARHGKDFHKKIGHDGGTISRGGGFTSETASVAGAKGGATSRRPRSEGTHMEQVTQYETIQRANTLPEPIDVTIPKKPTIGQVVAHQLGYCRKARAGYRCGGGNNYQECGQ